MSYFTAKLVSSIFPYSKIEGALSPAYAQSIHKDFYGEWDFNKAWKPINGFPTYLKWVVAVAEAQKKLKESNITVPILILHSSESVRLSTFSQEALSKDIVLNIEDIKRVGSQLGNNVTLLSIDNAIHDIFLSSKMVREVAFCTMFSWLSRTDFKN